MHKEKTEKKNTPLGSDIRNNAVRAAELANEKKATDTVVLELKELSTVADYFVICSGDNPAQIRAIAGAIDKFFSKKRVRMVGREGLDFARWVLLDYGDIVVHVFDQEIRGFYDLEKLWMDAPRIPEGEMQAQSEKRMGS
jgi:ribosome-associated protein